MKFILLTFLIFSCLSSWGQNSVYLKDKTDTVQMLIQKISEHNVLSSLLAGGDIMPTIKMQYERFAYLLSLVNNEELVQLVDSTKGCMRIYAYMGLCHKKYKQIGRLQQVLSSDTTQVKAINQGTYKVYTVSESIRSINHWYSEEYTNMLLTSITNSKLEDKSVLFEHLLDAVD